MRYVKTRYREYQRELAYRIYVSDTLFYRNKNQALGVRYYDMIYSKPDQRSADEIVADIIKNAGLEVKDW